MFRSWVDSSQLCQFRAPGKCHCMASYYHKSLMLCLGMQAERFLINQRRLLSTIREENFLSLKKNLIFLCQISEKFQTRFSFGVHPRTGLRKGKHSGFSTRSCLKGSMSRARSKGRSRMCRWNKASIASLGYLRVFLSCQKLNLINFL